MTTAKERYVNAKQEFQAVNNTVLQQYNSEKLMGKRTSEGLAILDRLEKENNLLHYQHNLLLAEEDLIQWAKETLRQADPEKYAVVERAFTDGRKYPKFHDRLIEICLGIPAPTKQ
jgi:hypothetical protein